MNNGGLPKTVSQYGDTLEEIFVCWEEVADLVGKDEMPNIPLGAVGIFSYAEKLRVGLAAADGRRPALQPPRHHPQRPDEPDRGVRPRSPASPTSWTPTARRPRPSCSVERASLSRRLRRYPSARWPGMSDRDFAPRGRTLSGAGHLSSGEGGSKARISLMAALSVG